MKLQVNANQCLEIMTIRRKCELYVPRDRHEAQFVLSAGCRWQITHPDDAEVLAAFPLKFDGDEAKHIEVV